MEKSSTEVEKGTDQLTDNTWEISSEVEVKMKMQAKWLHFISVQKFPVEDWHEQKLMNKCKRVASDEHKTQGKVSNNDFISIWILFWF